MTCTSSAFFAVTGQNHMLADFCHSEEQFLNCGSGILKLSFSFLSEFFEFVYIWPLGEMAGFDNQI